MSILISGGGGGGGGATTLNGLSDVNITSVANGQIIAYNNTSGQWENQTGLTGGLTYKGAFNATAGTPNLANALQGDFYVIDTAGTIYGQTWAVGDHLLINEDMGGSVTNSKIDKVDNTDQVTSVNGQTGAVTGLLEAANNLSDLTNIPTARSNLGALADVVEDTTPQLGGNLDVNGQSIVSASAGNIALTPDTTGSIVLDGLNWPQADGTTGQVLQTNGAGQLSFVNQTTGLQDVIDDTTPQLGGNLDVNGQSIVSASAGDIAITPDTTGSIVLDGLNWPQTDGSADQVLKTNGAGQLSFVDQTTGLQDVVDDTTPQLGGNLDVNGQSIVSASAGNIAITPDTTGSIVLDGLNWPQSDGTTGQVIQTNGAGQLSFVDQTTGLQDVVDDTTPQLGGNLDVNGQSIVSASAGNIAITPDTTGSIVLDGLNWPQADGTAGQVLQTNGAGQLSFTAPVTGLQDVVDDTTPQLGGDLDVQARIITTSTANGSIGLEPDGTGSVVARGTGAGNTPGTVTLNCEQNSHGVALQSPPHASAASYTLKLPTGVGTSGQALTTDGNNPAQLSWATAGASRPTIYNVAINTTIGADTAITGTEIERVYIVDTSGGARTMTLPQITGNVGDGYKVQIKRDGGNDVTITANAADRVENGSTGGSVTLAVDKSSFTLVCADNPSAQTNWYII